MPKSLVLYFVLYVCHIYIKTLCMHQLCLWHWTYTKSTTLVAPPAVGLNAIDVYTERPRVCSILYTRGLNMVEQEENAIWIHILLGKCYYHDNYNIIIALTHLTQITEARSGLVFSKQC